MAKVPILIVLLPQLLCTLLEVSGQHSPCCEYFTYIIDPATRQWMGQIQIPSAPRNVELHLKVTLSIGVALPTNYVGLLKVALPKEEFVRMDQRDKHLLYHIYFPLPQPRPLLTGIWFNDEQYCSGPYATGQVVTSITLDHTLYRSSVLPHSQNSSDSSQQNLSTSIQPNNSLSTQPTVPVYTSTLHTPIQSYECGISSPPITDNSLTSKGIKTSPGQWPWLVAIFDFGENQTRDDYHCVGTILTKKHVITAAHCLMTFTQSVSPDTLIASFGQYQFEWFEIGFLKREIASYTFHPDYNYQTVSSDYDLAILTLKTRVEFSPTIKPICMWHGSIDLQSVVNMVGYVIWKDPYTQESRMIEASIETCPWDIENRTTSSRIFCNGIREDLPFCSYGCGSGLMLYDPNTQRYQLRGILSTYRMQFVEHPMCEIIVFVDVAKHLSWIYQQISTEQ